MRVFRKRQLRLREEDDKTPSLNFIGDINNVDGSIASATSASTVASMPSDVTFSASNNNSNSMQVYNTGDVKTSDVRKAAYGGYPVKIHFDKHGKQTSGNTNESRFSGDLIEGAVMFSKKELRDFLKRL